MSEILTAEARPSKPAASAEKPSVRSSKLPTSAEKSTSVEKKVFGPLSEQSPQEIEAQAQFGGSQKIQSKFLRFVLSKPVSVMSG